ncbi:hypothetical protein ACFRI7_09170 [Streptomyces sp. NPDC056716]|uniref:hypothetical protein n=1 Tax=unclassified Streptomyces TaxID=2593676 RepID=UPI003673D1F3
MSYDLAVWEGDRPADDETAGEVFSNLYDQYMGDDEAPPHPPTDRIATYVAALLDRWCDITEDDEGTSPWATGPLIGEARGPLIHFPMSWSRAGEASAYAARLADSMGLICYDVQWAQLRS